MREMANGENGENYTTILKKYSPNLFFEGPQQQYSPNLSYIPENRHTCVYRQKFMRA